MRAHPAAFRQKLPSGGDKMATVGGAWQVLGHTFLQAQGTIAIPTNTTLQLYPTD